MTVLELKKLIKKLPDDMQVVMVLDEENLITVCKENSEVVTVKDDLGADEQLLLLLPCTCEIIDEDFDIDEAQLN
jgi:hypothetical protein